MLQIQLIGQCLVRKNGSEQELPKSKKTLALLGYLILTGRSQQRSHLCNLFWSDVEDPKAALRWSLAKLRALLNDGDNEVLGSDREQVVFNRQGVRIDVLDLQRGELEVLTEHRQVQELAESELMANLELPDCETYYFWLIAQRREVSELISTQLADLQFGLTLPPVKPVVPEADSVPQLVIMADPDLKEVVSELTARLSTTNKFELALQPARALRYQVHLESAGAGKLSVYLVDLRKGRVAWGEVFHTDEPPGLAVVSSRIVSAVVNAEFNRVQSLQESECSAWDFYIKSLRQVSRYSEEDILAAREFAFRSIALNPNFADAHAMAAVSYVYEGIYGWSGRSQATSLADAKTHIQNGQHVDPNDASVVRCAGLVQLYTKQHEAAELLFIRARDLDFYEPENHAVLGLAYGVQGRYDSALECIEFALLLSPRDHFVATWCSHLALSAALAGRCDDAVSWAEKCLVINPRFPGGYRSLAVGLAGQQKISAAKEAARQLLQLLPQLTIADLVERLPLVDSAASRTYLDALHAAGVPV